VESSKVFTIEYECRGEAIVHIGTGKLKRSPVLNSSCFVGAEKVIVKSWFHSRTLKLHFLGSSGACQPIPDNIKNVLGAIQFCREIHDMSVYSIIMRSHAEEREYEQVRSLRKTSASKQR
jgi:hypothetical protein